MYRLENGELPANLSPKVWWILIGTNDLKAGCSVQAIVAGSIRVVETLRQHAKTQSTMTPIVINSILPRGQQPLTQRTNAMWRMISQVNQQLACYAAIYSDTYFANVTDLFVQDSGNNHPVVHPDMFEKDHLHPSVNGSQVWEQFIVQKVLSLLGSM